MSSIILQRARRRYRMRLFWILAGMLFLGLSGGLVLKAFRENLVFYVTPSEVLPLEEEFSAKSIRLGGLVAIDSVIRKGTQTRFVITDTKHSIAVLYNGQLPDLFREGQGVVAEGRFRTESLFEARRVLAKHDENYRPPKTEEISQ